jgi:alcohol dehydrogenase
MENFEFLNKTKIVFGKGTEDRTGEIVKRYAKRKVLLHYGQGSIKRSGLYDTVRKSLDTAGIGYVELGGVQPNPRLKLVYQGIEICKNEGVEIGRAHV